MCRETAHNILAPRRTTRSQAPLGNQNKTSYVHLTRFIKPSSSERSIPRTTDCVKERRRRADPKTLLLKSSSNADQDVLLNGRHYVSLHGALEGFIFMKLSSGMPLEQYKVGLLIKSSLPLLLPYSRHFTAGETLEEEWGTQSLPFERLCLHFFAWEVRNLFCIFYPNLEARFLILFHTTWGLTVINVLFFTIYSKLSAIFKKKS